MTLNSLEIKNVAKTNLSYFRFSVFKIFIIFIIIILKELFLDEHAMVLRYTLHKCLYLIKPYILIRKKTKKLRDSE